MKMEKLKLLTQTPIYIALFTFWVNDWLLGGDIDYGPSSPGNGDGIIGGYTWIDADDDGKIDDGKWFDSDSNGIVDPGENEMVKTNFLLMKIGGFIMNMVSKK